MGDLYGSEDDEDVLALAESMRENENKRRKRRKRPSLGGALGDLVSSAPKVKGPKPK